MKNFYGNILFSSLIKNIFLFVFTPVFGFVTVLTLVTQLSQAAEKTYRMPSVEQLYPYLEIFQSGKNSKKSNLNDVVDRLEFARASNCKISSVANVKISVLVNII